MTGGLREEIERQIAYYECDLRRMKSESAVIKAKIGCYSETIAILAELLNLYDREHPDEKDGENDGSIYSATAKRSDM